MCESETGRNRDAAGDAVQDLGKRRDGLNKGVGAADTKDTS